MDTKRSADDLSRMDTELQVLLHDSPPQAEKLRTRIVQAQLEVRRCRDLVLSLGRRR